MAPIFKNIRQNSISNNRFTRYLLYAIGEIILVVIGILIALQVNNWNETRKADRAALIRLNAIKYELKENIDLAKEAAGIHQAVLDSTWVYLHNEKLKRSIEQKTRLIFLYTDWEPLKIDLPAIRQEINLDQVNPTRPQLNKRLRSVLVALKKVEDQYSYLQTITYPKINNVMIKNRVMVSFAESIIRDKSASAQLAGLYEDPDLKNAIANQFLILRVYNMDIDHLISEMQKTIKYIDDTN